MKKTEINKKTTPLESIYKTRKAYHGEFHDHSASGGTSDGKCSLLHWRCAMKVLSMDFATILDHKQVRHMTLPVWNDKIFIGGTEPGTTITDILCENNSIHYNMVFSKPEPLMELLEEFTEYQFSGGYEGHFCYPNFTRERFCALIDKVKEKGGFFVHPHPKQIMKSSNPLDYFFRDETGIEVFYRDFANDDTKENYKLWCDLLARGKRVWACAGGDLHRCASDKALTTVYAENTKSETLLSHFKEGDFVCGAVGIRMCVGNVKMGGVADFENAQLHVSVGDFHKSVHHPRHRYRMDLFDDTGIVMSTIISCTSPFSLTYRTDTTVRFYRVEVVDETRNLRIAVGNPIWNVTMFSENKR